MSKNKQEIKKEKVFKPVLNSNTLICEETKEIKYLTVIVDDIKNEYTQYICK